MLLVVTYSQAARGSLRNACRIHAETVVRRFGRAALFEPTEHGAFLALWLRAKHPEDVQIERTRALNEFSDVPSSVRDAVAAYAARPNPSTPYAAFAAGTAHPSPAQLREREL